MGNINAPNPPRQPYLPNPEVEPEEGDLLLANEDGIPEWSDPNWLVDPGSMAEGSLVVQGAESLEELAAGDEGDVLLMGATSPEWTAQDWLIDPGSLAEGSIVVQGAAALEELAAGDEGDILTMGATSPEWAAPGFANDPGDLVEGDLLMMGDAAAFIAFTPAHATLILDDGVTQQTGIDTTGATLTGFGADGPVAYGATPAFASNQITLDTAGSYRVAFDMHATGKASTSFLFHAQLDGVNAAVLGEMDFNATPAQESVSFERDIVADAGDVLTIHVLSDDAGGAELTPEYMTLVVDRLPLVATL